MSSKFFAIITGAGAGTGRAVALRFSKVYPVVLVAQRPELHKDTLSKITEAGGRAVGVTADVTDSKSLALAFDTIKTELPDFKLAAAVYHAGFAFRVKPFLECSPQILYSSFANVQGLFKFAQQTLPLLLQSVPDSKYPPTLLIPGSASSIRAAAHNSILAVTMYARRALAQSLAREFHPKGVHVAHTIVDGTIDMPRSEGLTINGGVEDGKLNTEAVAEAYWYLHTQHRSAFTQELDLRPYVQKY
ncbi:NAD(P)-binding protein [Xylaria sp. FL1042]|nr:NAD(P)-binding protein [Xylaria sp. FL1042]